VNQDIGGLRARATIYSMSGIGLPILDMISVEANKTALDGCQKLAEFAWIDGFMGYS
jgi:hypothetical protein